MSGREQEPDRTPHVEPQICLCRISIRCTTFPQHKKKSTTTIKICTRTELLPKYNMCWKTFSVRFNSLTWRIEPLSLLWKGGTIQNKGTMILCLFLQQTLKITKVYTSLVRIEVPCKRTKFHEQLGGFLQVLWFYTFTVYTAALAQINPDKEGVVIVKVLGSPTLASTIWIWPFQVWPNQDIHSNVY